MKIVNRESEDLAMFLSPGLEVAVVIETPGGDEYSGSAKVRSVTAEVIRLELAKGQQPYPPARAGYATVSGYSKGLQVRMVGTVEKSSGGRVLDIAHSGVVTLRQRRSSMRYTVSIPYVVNRAPSGSVAECESWWEQRCCQSQRPLVTTCKGGVMAEGWLGHEFVAPAPINLSTAGASFLVGSEVEPGELVSIDLLLPLDPPRIVHVVAYVMHCEPSPDGPLAGCCFVLAREKDLTAIAKYTSAVARSAAAPQGARR